MFRDGALYRSVTRAPGRWLTVAVWAVLVLVSLAFWHAIGVLRALGEHWPISALVVAVGLMIGGRLGRRLGLPLLFRNTTGSVWALRRPFWSGFGFTLLSLLVLTVMFICWWHTRYERAEPPAGGRAADVFDWRATDVRERLYRQAQADHPSGAGVHDHGYRHALSLVGTTAFDFATDAILPVWLLLAACLLTVDPVDPGASRPRHLLCRVVEFAGYALGCGVMWGVGWLLSRLHGLLLRSYDLTVLHRLHHYQAEHAWVKEVLGFTRFDELPHVASFLVFLALVLGLFVAVTTLFPRISPGLGICLLFCSATMLYLCLEVLGPGVQAVAVVAAAGFLVVINHRAYKYRLPGMTAYYEAPLDLERDDETVEQGEVPRGPCDGDGTPLLLNDRAVLDRWAGHVRSLDPGRRPKLVLVAVTGAAYRASFWTTIVLDEFGRRFPGFLDRVRLFTGASGGMVGAAYAVAMKAGVDGDGAAGDGPRETPTDRLARESGLDSLTPVVQQLIRRDIPMALRWRPQEYDRGRALEDQWGALDIPFERLRRGEAEGRVPSLVISPMVVETGRRLLFSNLDLYGLTDLRAWDRGGVSHEPGDDGPLPATGGLRRLSRSAVEFFRAFPATYLGAAGVDAFKVKTAVRLNATFPFVSPAISLPVWPPRRVVDAGYYDNYGINLAAAWAYQNRRWLRANTSGLAVVQIRAYESEEVRKRLWVGPRDRPASKAMALFQNLAVGLHALTTPLAGAMNAMSWSMSYRNDEQIQMLDNLFNRRVEASPDGETRVQDARRERGKAGWFESFVFENSVPFGMNWFIAPEEIGRMCASLAPEPDACAPAPEPGAATAARAAQQDLDRKARAHNQAQFRLFREWWDRPESHDDPGASDLLASESRA